MADPILSEEACRRVVAEVEYLGTARFVRLGDGWPNWWRELAWNLETIAETHWLDEGQPSARELVRDIAAAAATLQDALAQAPRELGGVTVQDFILRRLNLKMDTGDVAQVIASALRVIRRASVDAQAEHDRLAAMADRVGQTAPPKDAADMAILCLLEAFSGSFVDRDGEGLRPSHTVGDKPGPFLRFCEEALKEFSTAWAAAHPGVPLAFSAADASPARVRRMVKAWLSPP